MEYQTNGTATSELARFGSFKIAMNGQALASSEIPLLNGVSEIVNSGGSLSTFNIADWLGSPRVWMSYTGGGYSKSLAYAPFGQPYAGGGHGNEFTGQPDSICDGCTDSRVEYDFWARELHPIQGRWISTDPAGVAAADPGSPQSWNRYAYVLNNPLTNIDPSGLACFPFFEGSCDQSGLEGTNYGNGRSCDPTTDAACVFTPFTPAWISGFGQGKGNGAPSGFDFGFGFDLSFDGTDAPWGEWQTPVATSPGQAIQNAIGIIGLHLGCQTEFGAPCAPMAGNSFGPAGAVAGTIVCEILEPCGAVEDALLVTGLVVVGGYDIYKFSKGGKQNIVPSWAEGARPNAGESASQFADRLCKQQYPPDGAGCGSGPGSERSKIQKWARDKFGI